MTQSDLPEAPPSTERRYGEGWPGTPDPLPTKHRARWILGVAALVVVALTAVIALPRIIGDGPAESAPTAAWDPRVQDLVDFVEQERGLTFDHAVPVNFLSEKQFRKEVTTSANDLTPKEERDLRAAEAAFRALGLLDADVDLRRAFNTIGTQGVAAFYDPKRKQVFVHDGPLTPLLRATLVHELTHALQDQHFEILGTIDDAPDDVASAERALIEGDAQRIEQAYVHSLPSDERTLYQQESSDDRAASRAGLHSVPPVIRALFGSPYVLGQGLIETLLFDGDQARIDQAFAQPPTSEEHLLDPFTYLDGDQPIDVPLPALGPKEAEVDKGDLGAITWYLLLAERLDPRIALEAVDGWGGDSYVVSRSKEGFCLHAAFQGDDAGETDQMERALTEWADTMPKATADVTRDGDVLTLHSCDPGPAAATKGVSEQALLIPLFRTSLAIAYAQSGADRDIATCAANVVIARLPVDTLLKLNSMMRSKPFVAQIRTLTPDAIQSCQATAG